MTLRESCQLTLDKTFGYFDESWFFSDNCWFLDFLFLRSGGAIFGSGRVDDRCCFLESFLCGQSRFLLHAFKS